MTKPIADSLQKIIRAAQNDGVDTPTQAAELLRTSGVTWEDLLPFADFSHDIRDGYGRRAVAVGDHFELMVMSWKPGDFSAIHDHGNTQWGAVTYFGTAEHAVYDITGDLIRTTDRTRMSTGQINPVDHDLVHQMGNPTSSPLMSLHLYGCQTPEQTNISQTNTSQTADQTTTNHGVTGDARIFDLLHGEIQTTDGGVFYALPTDRINAILPGKYGDAETTRVHHSQMLSRIDRIVAARPDLAGEFRLTASLLMNHLYRSRSADEIAA